MNQTEKLDLLEHPESEKSFISTRVMAQYIYVNTRPDVTASVQLFAPGSEPVTTEEFKTFAKSFRHQKKSREIVVTFQQLDIGFLQLVLLTNPSFENARGLKNQLRFILLMFDEKGISNILYYCSSRCRRVTRSVMASEMDALVLEFDQEFAIRHLLEEILGLEVELQTFLESKTVFAIIGKDGQTNEGSLQIDINALKSST